MAKRMIAGILGTIAAVAGVLPLGYAFEIFKDFKNPDVSFWQNVLGELLACSIALAGLWIGIRFLRFAWSGGSKPINGWLRSILLGVLFFFPGFIFSLPLTILWARYTWPGDGQSWLAAMQVSLYIGVTAAIICCIVLLKKRNARHTS